jgi:hypothetical protein
MRTKAKSLAGSFLVFSALTACNSILGIEEAALDPGQETSALTCAYPIDDPTALCQLPASDPCEECVEREAPGVTSNCITAPTAGQTKSCRAALVEYRLCIGDDCRDENGNCATCLGGTPVADELGRAVQNCSACRQSRISSLCESYCACMSEKCGTTSTGTMGCLTDCENLSEYKRYCRWQHCERATDPSSPHCGHAIGGQGACNDDAADPAGLCEGIWNGLGCDESQPEKCCSGICRGGICTQN